MGQGSFYTEVINNNINLYTVKKRNNLIISDQDNSLNSDEGTLTGSEEFRKFQQELIKKDYRDLIAYSDLEQKVDSILKKMTNRRSTADINVLNQVTVLK